MKWFIAEVIDPASDPAQSGSVKIRIQGHQDKLSEDQLRNAKPMFPVNNPISKKKGGPVTGLLKGSQVIGFFLDGEAAQIPVLLGTIGSEGKRQNNQVDYTKGDTPVAHKDKQNNEGKKLGGGDYRFIAGKDRLDGEDGDNDTKSVLEFAKDEAKNPTGDTTMEEADNGEQTYSVGQDDP